MTSSAPVEFFGIYIAHILIQPEFANVINSEQAKLLYADYSLHDNRISRLTYFSYDILIRKIFDSRIMTNSLITLPNFDIVQFLGKKAG